MDVVAVCAGWYVSADRVGALGQTKAGPHPHGSGVLCTAGSPGHANWNVRTRRGGIAAVCAHGTLGGAALSLLLLAVFPANLRAARERLTIGGQQVPALFSRTLLQIVFLSATLAVVLGR